MKNYPVVCIIPSLNPDESLVSTVRSIVSEGFSDVIVVDDGSIGTCSHYFEQIKKIGGVVVLHHNLNKGKGAALKTAFNYYINNYSLKKYVGIVTADADGQHLSKDIKNVSDKMINRIEEKGTNNKCLYLGTRNFDEDNVPFKSRNGNKITTKVFKLLFGKWINDTQTGLRGIANEFIYNCLQLKEDRFEYEINMLIEAVRKNVEIEEVIIETVYFKGNRETHFRPIKDSLKIYFVMLKSFLGFTCSGILSWAVDWSIFSVLANVVFDNPNDKVTIIVSTVAARVISSFLNYLINKKLVFQYGGKNSLVRYYMLCVLQMFASAGLVAGICNLTSLISSIVKIFVDLILFIVNYKIQQDWVFQGE